MARAQEYYSTQDTADLNKAMQVQPSEVQLSATDKAAASDSIKKASYLLQRLKDVIAVKKDVLYGSEITPLTRQLQDSNYVLVQPVVSVKGKGVLLGLINQVGSLFEGNNTEPWLKLNTEIVPQQDKSIPFTLDAKLTGSAKIQASWLTTAETKMDSVYKNKKYQKIELALEDIKSANAVALAYLQKAIGKTLAPPFVLKVNNTKYWGGVKIPLWQKTGADSTHLIEFVTRNGQNPEGDITWTCSTLVKTNYDQAWVNVKKAGNSTLTVTYQDSLTQTFTLNVSTSDVKELLVAKAKDVMIVWLKILYQSAIEELKDQDSIKLKRLNELSPLLTTMNTNMLNLDMLGTQKDSSDVTNISSSIILSQGDELSVSSSLITTAQSHQKTKEIFEKSYTVTAAGRMASFLEKYKQVVYNLMEPNGYKQLEKDFEANLGKIAANVLFTVVNGGTSAMEDYIITYLLDITTQKAKE
ncbi:MAG: hypothetical protein U0V72_10240 [Cytophagales bacterium]